MGFQPQHSDLLEAPATIYQQESGKGKTKAIQVNKNKGNTSRENVNLHLTIHPSWLLNGGMAYSTTLPIQEAHYLHYLR